MPESSLFVLTEELFFPPLDEIIRAEKTDVRIIPAFDLATLKSALEGSAGLLRLAAFCTGVIVPPDVLSAFNAGAYNFHPGPPAFPGIFPSCFAIYDGATSFGATAHAMTATVDGGEIVGTNAFAMPPGVDRLHLDQLACDAALTLFKSLAPQLVNLNDALPATGESWTGPVRTRKDFQNLCQLPSGVGQDEFDRRYRAVGEGPDHALTMTLFGHRFRLDNQRQAETVIKGGKPQ